MPSYVITPNGARVHIRKGYSWLTLCGRLVEPLLPGHLGWQVCVKCLDRAARMSKREE